MQAQQSLPSPVAASPLRIYVYDMPSEFTTLNLQWRNGPTMGNHRAFSGDNRSYFAHGSLYAMETAMHEWLLDSPLRTTDAAQAHLRFVPTRNPKPETRSPEPEPEPRTRAPNPSP